MAGTMLPLPIVVEVRDQAGRPAPNMRLAFSAAAGTVSSTAATTDQAGQVSVAWTLGWTPGRQELHVNGAPGSGLDAATFIVADADVNPAADLVVVRGAGSGSVSLLFMLGHTIRQRINLRGIDTVLYSAPDEDHGDQWVAAFASRRLPGIARANRRPGTDTIALELLPEFDVPLSVWILDESAAVRDAAERDLASTDAFWRATRWGLRIGDVRMYERGQFSSAISCSSVPPGDVGRVNIYYSTGAQITPFGGYSCSDRTIIMRQLSGAPMLLAHELGHSFGLGHPPDDATGNFMHPSAVNGGVELWQIFNAHLTFFSALVRIYALRSEEEQQACCIVPPWFGVMDAFAPSDDQDFRFTPIVP